MKKIALLALFAIAPSQLFGRPPKVKKEELPAENTLKVHNETEHKIYLLEGKSFRAIGPMEGIILGWKKALKKENPRTLAIYYGGNINDKNFEANFKGKKSKQSTGPFMIAQLKTNQPGVVALRYSKNGILKVKRLA